MNDEFEALTFDDVLLVPQYSDIETRQDVTLKTRFSRNVELDIPVVAANMDTVCETEMAQAMADMGGIGVIHRFLTIEDQAQMVYNVQGQVAAAVGVGEDTISRAGALIEAGASALVIDVAHGHSALSITTLVELKRLHRHIDVVAGNVATPKATGSLLRLGADGIKVGIGPGGFCTTRIVAGTGMPQLTAIQQCSNLAYRVVRAHTCPDHSGRWYQKLRGRRQSPRSRSQHNHAWNTPSRNRRSSGPSSGRRRGGVQGGQGDGFFRSDGRKRSENRNENIHPRESPGRRRETHPL